MTFGQFRFSKQAVTLSVICYKNTVVLRDFPHSTHRCADCFSVMKNTQQCIYSLQSTQQSILCN